MRKIFFIIAILISLVSCKDTDGDGVYDKNDKCPNTYGLEQFDGCPDSDDDGIIDSEDDCPDDYGLEEFNGCPDTDGDGIPDNEDVCPDTYGYRIYDGCPNNDHVRLIVSDCLEPFGFTQKEISELLTRTEYTLNSTINMGICDILFDMVISQREYDREMRRFAEEKRRLDERGAVVDAMGEELNEGYIQGYFRRGGHTQFIVVLKGGVYGTYYLMQVISGGEISTGGTMKFDETSYDLQKVWVRHEAFKLPATRYTMKLIDSSKIPYDFEHRFN